MTPIQYTAYEADLRRTIEHQAAKMAEQQRTIDEQARQIHAMWHTLTEIAAYRCDMGCNEDALRTLKELERQNTTATFDPRQIKEMQRTIDRQARQLDVARRALEKYTKTYGKDGYGWEYLLVTGEDAQQHSHLVWVKEKSFIHPMQHAEYAIAEMERQP